MFFSSNRHHQFIDFPHRMVVMLRLLSQEIRVTLLPPDQDLQALPAPSLLLSIPMKIILSLRSTVKEKRRRIE
jgi:hypothetical protein